MKLGHIYYMHDSTESTEDSFTLSASAYEIERRSLPVTISVTVIPVNDEPPRLTRNTGLEVMFCSFDLHSLLLLWAFLLNNVLDGMLLQEKSLKCKFVVCWILFQLMRIQADHNRHFVWRRKEQTFYHDLSKQENKHEYLKLNDQTMEKWTCSPTALSDPVLGPFHVYFCGCICFLSCHRK